MVQLQCLSYVLNTKSMKLLEDNAITEDYFPEYSEEFSFIKGHYDEYGVVPDVETVLEKFPELEILEVSETENYLVNTIREEYLYAKSVPVIKKAAELLKADANEASRYLQSELVNLTPNYTVPSVDIIHSTSRAELFKDKGENKDKWYTPTGFEELDDVVNGWQSGEELVVLFARTGQGKSWMLVKSMHQAWLMGKNVGYISPEMSADKIGYRFDTINNHYSNRALVRGDTQEVDYDDYMSYIQSLSDKENRFLVSTPQDFNRKITVSKLKSYIVSNELDILAIDGITYLQDERYIKGDNKTTSLTNISEDLMQLSVECRIPILIVVQSNRGGVNKDDEKSTPDLENIRDSDGIAYNATKVLSLRQKDNDLIIDIKKNRDGITGSRLCYVWNIDTGDFEYKEEEGGYDESVEEEKLTKRKKTERRNVF